MSSLILQNYDLFLLELILCVLFAVICFRRVGGGNPDDKAQVRFMIKNNPLFFFLSAGFKQERINGYSILMQFSNIIYLCVFIFSPSHIKENFYYIISETHIISIACLALLMLADSMILLFRKR